MNTKRLIMKALFIAFTMITFNQIIVAQVTKGDDQLSDIVSTLSQKVLLSTAQESQVLSILTDLKSKITSKPESKDTLVKDAQSKVESLLDKKQKMKYDILKNDLWKKIAG